MSSALAALHLALQQGSHAADHAVVHGIGHCHALTALLALFPACRVWATAWVHCQES